VDPVQENSYPGVGTWLVRSRTTFSVADDTSDIPPFRLMWNPNNWLVLTALIKILIENILAHERTSTVTLASVLSAFRESCTDLNSLPVFNVFAGVQNWDVNLVDLVRFLEKNLNIERLHVLLISYGQIRALWLHPIQ
jgi:hypothetical protein